LRGEVDVRRALSLCCLIVSVPASAGWTGVSIQGRGVAYGRFLPSQGLYPGETIFDSASSAFAPAGIVARAMFEGAVVRVLEIDVDLSRPPSTSYVLHLPDEAYVRLSERGLDGTQFVEEATSGELRVTWRTTTRPVLELTLEAEMVSPDGDWRRVNARLPLESTTSGFGEVGLFGDNGTTIILPYTSPLWRAEPHAPTTTVHEPPTTGGGPSGADVVDGFADVLEATADIADASQGCADSNGDTGPSCAGDDGGCAGDGSGGCDGGGDAPDCGGGGGGDCGGGGGGGCGGGAAPDCSAASLSQRSLLFESGPGSRRRRTPLRYVPYLSIFVMIGVLKLRLRRRGAR
jgi:hypothetical protein